MTRKCEKIVLTNFGKDEIVLILEPWGYQYSMAPNDRLTVEIDHDIDSNELIEIAHYEDSIAVYAPSRSRAKVLQNGIEIPFNSEFKF